MRSSSNNDHRESPFGNITLSGCLSSAGTERERQKASDAKNKIKLLEDELSRLGMNV